MKNKVLSLITLATAGLLLSPSAQAVKIYRTGSPNDVVKSTTPVTCLAGGGSDDLWSAGWKTMLTQANGGDVVIIRADGQRGGYEDWIFNDTGAHSFPKVNSVSTIQLTRSDDAGRSDIERLINKAELVFFAGGNQYDYIRLIKGTKMEAALNSALHTRKVPFGGTSAGMAILGDLDYSSRYSSPAKKGSNVTAVDVLKNPTGTFVDLDRGFIKADYMDKVITDTHFSQRSRQGRLVGFMARAVYNNYGDINALNVKGIGADEGTAVCYDVNGQAQVVGANTAFFLSGNTLIERIMAGAGLDWFGQRQAIKVYAIPGTATGASFDLVNWTGTGGQSKYWYVDGTDPLNPILGNN